MKTTESNDEGENKDHCQKVTSGITMEQVFIAVVYLNRK
jgi:hypothetical protein